MNNPQWSVAIGGRRNNKIFTTRRVELFIMSCLDWTFNPPGCGFGGSFCPQSLRFIGGYSYFVLRTAATTKRFWIKFKQTLKVQIATLNFWTFYFLHITNLSRNIFERIKNQYGKYVYFTIFLIFLQSLLRVLFMQLNGITNYYYSSK